MHHTLLFVYRYISFVLFIVLKDQRKESFLGFGFVGLDVSADCHSQPTIFDNQVAWFTRHLFGFDISLCDFRLATFHLDIDQLSLEDTG